VSELKAGADGTLYGLNPSAILYNYTVASGWVEAPSALQTAGGNGLTHISVASASQVLALSSSASNNVFVLNSSGTAWIALNRRLSTAEIGPDGSIWGMDSSGAIWCYISGNWTHLPGQLTNLAVASAENAWGVNSSGTLMQWNGTAFAAAPTPPFTPSQVQNAIAVWGETFLAILDTSGGIHVLNNSGSVQPTQPLAISSLTCKFENTGGYNGDVCVATVPSVAGIQIGDSFTIAGNSVGNGTWTALTITGCSPSPCAVFYGTKFGTATGGSLTDNTVANYNSNAGKWHTVMGTASAVTGAGALTFALAGGVSYHLNLTVPAHTVTATVSHQCTRGGCILQTLTAQALFGGPGGAHGTAGVTTQTSGYEPDNLQTAATEQGVNCDPFFDNHNGGCSPYYQTCANCSGGCSGLIGVTVQIEDAFTQSYWNGAPLPACSKLCTYKVQNNCTAATTPPDNSIGFINSGNYVGIATYVSWVSATGCIRFHTSGPWTCLPALSFINSLNVVTPPYACTHNP
jgi:hypothetical protein